MAKATTKKIAIEQNVYGESMNDTIEQDVSEETESNSTPSSDDVSSEEITSDEPALTVEQSLPKDLHIRLTKEARALSTGGQEKHFAIHQLEHLTGKLKMALPAGIATTEDEDLKASLKLLLDLL
jgi:hypothetical protein